MELTEEQKLVTGIADYFNIEVPDIISEYVTDSVTVQRMIYAIVTVRNTERLKRLYNANKNTFYDAVQNYHIVRISFHRRCQVANSRELQ